MTNRQIAAGIALLLLVGFAFGRWTAPEKIKIEKEQVQVEATTKDSDNKKLTDTNRDKKYKTVITEVTKPDGTKTKKTEIVEDTTTRRITKTDDKQQETSTKVNIERETKEVENHRPSVAIRGLVGTDFSHLSTSIQPIYGGAVDKQIFGPISAGVWGLTNGTCGMSFGLTF